MLRFVLIVIDLKLFHSSAATSSDSETMLRHQQEQHELIAEEIISLTRNLKHNITVSGKIIKDDTAVSIRFFYASQKPFFLVISWKERRQNFLKYSDICVPVYIVYTAWWGQYKRPFMFFAIHFQIISFCKKY